MTNSTNEPWDEDEDPIELRPTGTQRPYPNYDEPWDSLSNKAQRKWNRLSEGYPDTDLEEFLVSGHPDSDTDDNSLMRLSQRAISYVRQCLYAVEELIARDVVPESRELYEPSRKYQYTALNVRLSQFLNPHDRRRAIWLNPSERRAIHQAILTLEQLQGQTPLADASPPLQRPECAPSIEQLKSLRESVPLAPKKKEAYSDVHALSNRLNVTCAIPECVDSESVWGIMFSAEAQGDDLYEATRFVESQVQALYRNQGHKDYFEILVECIDRLASQRSWTEWSYVDRVDLLWPCIEYVLKVGYDRGYLRAINRYRVCYAVRQVVDAVAFKASSTRDRAFTAAVFVCLAGSKYERYMDDSSPKLREED